MGLKVERIFSSKDIHPFDQVEWEKRDVEIRDDKTNEVIFERKNVEVPKSWSLLATKIVASRYFYDKENSVKDLIERVCDTLSKKGYELGYFSKENSEIFENELIWLCLNQYGSFNSPVWFNVGIWDYYKVPGTPTNWRWDFEQNKAVPCENGYEFPQCSACFLQSVEDNMVDIMRLARDEAMLFKYGSGTGTDLSTLRAKCEGITGGGTPSGPVSFLEIYDQIAGVVKSGGTTRRAARLNCLHVWHPDIEEFIMSKLNEEKKAWDLIDSGWEPSDAYNSIKFQNTNISVRVTDEFMQSVDSDKDFWTRKVTTGEKVKKYKARDLLRMIAECAWNCGDPGLQYHNTTNSWHTCKESGNINTSNPCQPGFAAVATPEGIKMFDDVSAGDIIWSGSRWTKIERKWSTGVKSVYKYKTNAGSFIGTKDHKIVENKIKIKVKEASKIDTSQVISFYESEFDTQSVLDGLLIGDGTVKRGKNSYILLCIGENDRDYFKSEIKNLVIQKPFDRYNHRIRKTRLNETDLPKTYNRTIPDFYFKGNASIVSSFLRGLYSANGSVKSSKVTKRIDLKTTSITLLEQVQQMLSFLGIKSYYTTNKSKKCKFDNGTYQIKESYDLSITTDRYIFRDKIGFIQKYKNDKLDCICEDTQKGRSQTSYDIKEVEYLGDFEVFDIQVEDKDHTYWTGGLLVSNCSEFVFLDNTACNLASLNLMKFRKTDGSFDTEKFGHAVRFFILAQEIIVDSASYPNEKICENSHKFRPLGLGYANLGTYLMSKGIPYDSDEGRKEASSITLIMHGYAYLTSAEIASEKGPFEEYEKNKNSVIDVIKKHHSEVYTSEYISLSLSIDLWDQVLKIVKKYGVRNSQVTLLAPTGTIGLKMDCDTTGIEPELALVKYKRLTEGSTQPIINKSVYLALEYLGYKSKEVDSILKHIEKTGTIEGSILKEKHLPVFDCAFKSEKGSRSIHYSGHVKMMSAVQPFLSGAISKTCCVPNDATVEDIEKIYIEGWKLGLKAISIYRDGSKKLQPLSTGKKKEKSVRRKRLPETRESITHKFSVANHKGYLTVGLYPDGSPGEIFISMAKEGSTIGGIMDAFGIQTSLALQHGVPLKTMVSKFKHIKFDPNGMTSNKDISFANSIVDYIFKWMENKFLVKKEGDEQTSDAPVCDICGAITVRNGTCYRCLNCGNSLGCS